MAKQEFDYALYRKTIKDVENGIFSPIYILMGEEPFYTEELCSLIMEKALEPHERDFNQHIFYGADADIESIISLCCEFPMMAQRRVVVIKEGQLAKKIEDLEKYLPIISPTTVLVVCINGKSLDKRSKFYKEICKKGVVIESPKIREDRMPQWICDYFASRGLRIDNEGATLMAEYAGNDLRKIKRETDKLTKTISPTEKTITVAHIEKNVGISREYSITELTNALAVRDAGKAFKLAYYFGESPKTYPLPKTLGFLFFFFSKLEQLHATSSANKSSIESTAKMMRLFGPYIAASRSYSLSKTMKIIAYLREYDIKSKNGTSGSATEGELLTELIGKILA